MTKLSTSLLPLLLALPLAACGGDDEVDIVGDSPEEAAAELADAICEQNAECGQFDISCSGNDDGSFDCTVTHEEVTYDSCVAELEPEIRADLECADPTDAQAAQINDCINALLERSCVSEEEMQEYVDAIERGEDPVPPGGAEPVACEVLEDAFESCED